jgi:LPXTG-motif cell wall-anchored protein
MVTPLPDNTVDPVGENPPDDDINLGGDSVDQINEGNEGDTVNTVNSSPLGDDEVTTVKSSQNRLGASLPQTGQLWWPVFVLAGTGLGSITIGVRRRKDSK